MSTKGEVLPLNESSSVSTLSEEETRQILTPFAFDIDKSLFGTALASPTKRALAICIDLFFVALLSDTPGEILALVIAITLYRLGSKQRTLKLGKQKGRKRRKLLRFFAYFIIFVVLLNLLPTLFNQSFIDSSSTEQDSTNNVVNLSEQELSMGQAIAFSALSGALLLTINNSECIDLNCWKSELSPLVKGFSSFNLKHDILNDSIKEIAEATALNKVQRAQLETHLFSVYQQSLLERQAEKQAENEAEKQALEKITDITGNTKKIEQQSNKEIDNNLLGSVDEIEKQETKPVYSVIQWIKALIEDLGLGFGWAAFYFTVFTALWHGQTPGKKIVGIRVLQLDGTPLSMWDSFGRYGGYGAGIATGLLGFLQIFWNANRQAIQDQISATVVIDDRKQNK
ncbi:MAG: RDD family protein [Colwellia sp.]|nr:RDD family protein [Colwellia sp.]